MISRMKQMIGSFSRMLVDESVMFPCKSDAEQRLGEACSFPKIQDKKLGWGVHSADAKRLGSLCVCVRVEEEAHRQTQELHMWFCSAGSHLPGGDLGGDKVSPAPSDKVSKLTFSL